MNFQELRAFLWESERGRVFDSLIAVECGLEMYEASWDAMCDIHHDLETNDIIVNFLVDIGEYIGVEDSDFEKVLAHVE
jgi:hypothetical protein